MFIATLLLAFSAFSSGDVLPAPFRMELGESGKAFRIAGARIKCDVPLHAETHRLLHQMVAVSKHEQGTSGGVMVFTERPLSDASFRSFEAYELHISPDSLHVVAATPTGFLRATQTLVQMCDKKGRVPCGRIADAPAYEWRGLMIDVSRHFFPVEFLKKQIDIMAAHKLNRLHLHLTDAAGWRMEIKRYPRLTTLAAWRDAALWKDWWHGTRKYAEQGTPQAYGGYYTQRELRELVAYAAERGIDIVPEIEMPAHSEEVLAAYPELSCTSASSCPSDFCAGNEAVYDFLQNVLDEVMDVFPSRYIHLGGDEAGKESWKTCLRCRRTMIENDMTAPDSMPDPSALERLQAHFMRRMGRYLSAHGRRMIGWDEVIDATLPEDAAVMVWRDLRHARRAAALGREVILSPAAYCYLDAYQDAPPSQPEAIGGYLPFEQVAAFSPETFADEVHRRRIKGVQGNLWTEYVSTPDHAEYMLYPRMLALAEIGWSGASRRSASDLRRTVINRVAQLRENGVRAFDLRTAVGQRALSHPLSHKALGASVVYHRPFSASYAASGVAALTDGRCGGWSYHDGVWQGFLADAQASCPSLDVTLDLGTERRISWVGADFMQVCNPEIFYPSAFRVSVSRDGQNYTLLGEQSVPSQKTILPDIRTFFIKRKARARYIRVQASPSAFGGWLFTDEIIVK